MLFNYSFNFICKRNSCPNISRCNGHTPILCSVCIYKLNEFQYSCKRNSKNKNLCRILQNSFASKVIDSNMKIHIYKSS